MKKDLGERLYFPFTICLVGIISYIMAAKLLQLYWSDISIHVNFARDLFNGNFNEISAYPAFHLTYGLFRCFTHTSTAAAALSYAFFSMLCGIAVYFISWVFLGSLSIYNTRINCAIVFFITMFGPIVFPENGVSYYLGQGSFNAWHSPTNNAVKFAAFLSFFLFSRLHNRDEKLILNKKELSRKQQLILLSVITFISLLCKPSFCQVFLPSAAIIILYDLIRKKISFNTALVEILTFVPAGIFLMWQFLKVFIFKSPSDGSGVIIKPFLVWGEYSGNIFISILRAVFFPMFVFSFCYIGKKEKGKSFKYAIVFYAVSVVEYALLAESGDRMSDANFQWGMNLAFGILFLSSIFEFIRWNVNTFRKDEVCISKRLISVVGYAILSMHFLLGTWYYIKLLSVDSLQYF